MSLTSLYGSAASNYGNLPYGCALVRAVGTIRSGPFTGRLGFTLSTYGNVGYGMLRGPTVLTDSISEALTALDSLAAQAVLSDFLSDTVSTGDSVTAAATVVAAIADSVSALDSLGGSLSIPILLTDTLTASDGLAATMVIAFNLSDSVQATDAINASLTLSESLAETLVASDGMAEVTLHSPPAWRVFTVTGTHGITVLQRKTPDEMPNYRIDWSRDLGGDTIIQSEWSSYPSGLSFQAAIGRPATSTLTLVSGGEANIEYVVTNTITTAAGNTREDSFKLFVDLYNFL